MTINEYQKEALRTASNKYTQYPMILNGVLGLGGESGECLDIVKKHLFQGHTLDKEHLAEELGDVAWYLAVSAYALGYELESILQMNVDKLRKRYPEGFDSNRSVNRNEDTCVFCGKPIPEGRQVCRNCEIEEFNHVVDSER